MTNNDAVDKVAEDLKLRAQVILDEGHSQKQIMSSAFADFKAMGNISGIMAVMSTGKLTTQQIERAKRVAVKVIALLGMLEAENNKGHVEDMKEHTTTP